MYDLANHSFECTNGAITSKRFMNNPVNINWFDGNTKTGQFESGKLIETFLR